MTLPDADRPRKPPRRRWLFAPYIVLLIVAIAWSAGWFYLRLSATRTLDQTAEQLRAAGYQVSWGERRISGYPFRLATVLTDVRIAEPSGWALSIPELRAEAAVYALGRWTAAAPLGADMTRPKGGVVAIRGELLRASLSDLGKRPPHIIVEGRKLTFLPIAGGAPYLLSSAESLIVDLRPGPDDQAALLFKVDNAGARFSGLLARIAQDRPVSMTWESILSHASAFKGPDWPTAVQAWTAGGGAIRVRNAGITAGDALGTAKSGDLTVGADGRLRGALQVELREAPQTMVGATPEQAAAAAAVAMARGGGDGTAQASISFVAGQTMLGPVPVGPAPRVY